MRTYLSLAVFAVAAGVLAAGYTMAAAPGTPPATRAGAARGATATPAAPAAAPAASAPAAKVDPTMLDKDGYIRQWLILGPIYFGMDYSADNIEKDQITGEAALAPKEGDKQKVKSVENDKPTDKEFAWKK